MLFIKRSIDKQQNIIYHIKEEFFIIKNYNWSIKDLTYLTVFLLINLIVYFYTGSSNILGLIASVTGLFYAVFVAKADIRCYLLAIINMSIYIYISFKAKLYGEVMLHSFYHLPMQFIGLFLWWKNLKEKQKTLNKNTISSKNLTKSNWFYLIIIMFFMWLIYSKVLVFLGGNTTYIDSSSTVVGVCAMFLCVNRYVEQWYLWIIVNSISMFMWILAFLRGTPNSLPMIIMWLTYLTNSGFGLYNWKKIKQ